MNFIFIFNVLFFTFSNFGIVYVYKIENLNKSNLLFMYRFLTLVCCFLLTVNLSFGQSSLKSRNYKGKVKTVTEKSYELTKGGKKYMGKEYMEFNENGRETLGKDYGSSDNLTMKVQFVYDDKGNRIEYYFRGYGSMSKSEYTFDENNCAIEQKEFDEKYNLEKTTKNKYDEHNNLIDTKMFAPDGTPKGHYSYEYTYDNEGRVIAKKRFYKGEFTGSEIWRYNKAGKKEEYHRLNAEGGYKGKETYKYDEQGNTIYWKYDPVTRAATVYEYEYTYDSNGNWITKKTIENGEDSWFYEQTLEFY